MKTKCIKLTIVVLLLALFSVCFASWDNTKPADSDAWNDAAGYIRDNWDALEVLFGTDFAIFDNANNHDDLEDAISDIGATETMLWVHEAEVVSDDLTIPANVTLFFTRGGTLAPASTKTITLAGFDQVIAGNFQIFTGAGTVTFTDRNKVNCVWYSDSGSGISTSKWVNGLRDAYAANGAYHHYYLPGGFYEDASTIDLDGAGFMTISGDGVSLTKIHYTQTDDSSCIKIHNSSTACHDVWMRDISFWGEDTATGAAIEIEDLRDQGGFERIEIYKFNGNNTGTGIWTKGIAACQFRNIYIGDTEICFLIDDNPQIDTDLDLCTFSNMSLWCDDSDNGYGFKITAEQFYNMTIGDNIAIGPCKYGIYCSPSSPADYIYDFTIKNVRFEQGDTVNKDCWAVYLNADSTRAMRGVTLSNIDFGSNYKGLYLRYCTNVSIIGSRFHQAAGYTQWDFGANCESIALFNCFYAYGGTQTTSLSTVYSMREVVGSGVGFIGYELYDKTAQVWTGRGPTLLSTTTIDLSQNGEPDIYTVPTGNRCILSHALLVAGADAGTSDISIGADGAETDFVGTTNLDNLNAQYDMVLLAPVPSATPATLKSYAATTLIEAKVSNFNGGATNTLYLFGTLY